MKKVVLYLLFIFSCGLLTAQSQGVYSSAIKYDLLPDAGYSFDQVRTDTSLHFVSNDSLRPNQNKVYWFRIAVDSLPENGQAFYMRIHPEVDNTIYYFDKATEKWKTRRSGRLVWSKQRHEYLFFEASKGESGFIYVKTELHDFGITAPVFLPACWVIEKDYVENNEQYIFIAWLITFVVILIYLLNIAIDYIATREETTIYYSTILAGCLIYITGFHKLTNIFFSFKYCRFDITNVTTYYNFDLPNTLVRVGLYIIVLGFVFLTRLFLNSRKHLPLTDKILKWSLAVYLFTGVSELLLTLFASSKTFTPYFIINNWCLIYFFAFIMVVGLLSLRYEKRNARLFLIANIIPFLVAIIMAGYMSTTIYSPYKTVLLPFLGVLSFAITFAIAIGVRNRNTRNDLQQKEVERKMLAIEKEKMQLQNALISSRNEVVETALELKNKETENLHLKNKEIEIRLQLEKAETENLQLKLDLKNREVVSSNLNISQKNEVFEKIKKEVDNLSKQTDIKDDQPLQNIRSMLRNHDTLETTWDTFKLNFELVHPNFFANLIAHHPDLTPNELKLCAYLKLNLTNKEIAAIQHIHPASVKRAKIRLKKKLNPETTQGIDTDNE
ncbi:MAG: 7TM diverse intracellular signaling domain-containing protein [Bacteroidota bacterium]